MIQAVKNSFRNYATFGGRATRLEFWSFMLLFAVCTVGAHQLDALDGTVVPVAAGMATIELVVFLLLLLPTITVGARRLHDTGRSGWWLLFLYLPYLAFVTSAGNEKAMIASSAALLLGTAVLAVQLCMPGQKGENQFGPDPKPFEPLPPKLP